jgi:cytochrome c-type biogenesis protein CcmH/NrfF
MKILCAVVAGALMVLSGAGTGLAAADPAEVANRISSEIMSPFCDGVTLHECPSEEAVALRGRIERWVRRGWSEAQITERLERAYGPSVRALPPSSGTGALAWIVPGLALAGGAVWAWSRARLWSARTPSARPPEVSDEERRRLEVELAWLRGEAE